jgi:N-acetylneuraminic acid mutarotase
VIYDVTRDRWHPMERTGIGDRYGHTAVWTGEEMIVWGGFSGSVGLGRPGELRADGAVYDPRSTTWRVISPAPLAPRSGHVAVWTGEEMIVWGGSRPHGPLRGERERLLYDGAAYDPQSDTWRRLAPTRLLAALVPVLPSGVEPDLNAVWTGDAMLIWGPNGGAGYDPEHNRWERIPTPPADFGVTFDGSTAVWTGDQMIVWGGVNAFEGSDFFATGAAYDPEQKRWTQLPEAPVSGREQHAAIWTGQGMLIWGGCCHRGANINADGAIYLPDR